MIVLNSLIVSFLQNFIPSVFLVEELILLFFPWERVIPRESLVQTENRAETMAFTEQINIFAQPPSPNTSDATKLSHINSYPPWGDNYTQGHHNVRTKD